MCLNAPVGKLTLNKQRDTETTDFKAQNSNLDWEHGVFHS